MLSFRAILLNTFQRAMINVSIGVWVFIYDLGDALRIDIPRCCSQ